VARKWKDLQFTWSSLCTPASQMHNGSRGREI